MRFQLLFGVVMAIFLGILVAAYTAARHANPILLDEHGRPVAAAAR